MPRKQSDVEKGLKAKGFRPRDGDHTYFIYHSLAGKKTRVFTKTSHGGRDINDSLLAMMARQCRLSSRDFSRLVDCPLARDAYESLLVEAGAIERGG